MRRIFDALARVVSFALLAFTIYWLPKDIQDSPQAAAPWRKFIAMLDQNTLLWCLVIALILSMIWSDLRPAYRAWAERRRKHPLEVSFSSNTYEWERIGDKIYTIGSFELKNSLDTVLEGIEVHLIDIEFPNRGQRTVRRKLYPEGKNETRFDVLPGQSVGIKLFRFQIIPSLHEPQKVENKSEIGPFQANEYVDMCFDGTYKLEIEIYGRNITPIREAVGIATRGSTYSLGRWTKDFKLHLHASCRVHPGTELEMQP